MVKDMAKKPVAKKRATNGRLYHDILYEIRDQVAWAAARLPSIQNISGLPQGLAGRSAVG